MIMNEHKPTTNPGKRKPRKGSIGINRIQAFVMPENIKSQNVLQRNGFVKEGTIRQGHVWKGHGVVDLILYSLLKTDIEE
jgi:ribosomal-protein-alanine N-acetyltransferase